MNIICLLTCRLFAFKMIVVFYNNLLRPSQLYFIRFYRIIIITTIAYLIL